MRNILFFLLICFSATGQVKVVSWNVQNLGNAKSDSIVQYIASVLQDADIIALQEVVPGAGGVQSVARLANKLSHSGTKYRYVVSKPTSGLGTERYAYIWKSRQISIKNTPWLDQYYSAQINREPFFATFTYKSVEFTLASFHAVPKKKQPETEIKYFKFYPKLYPVKNLIFLGDFNLPQSHSVFNSLKNLGYKAALTNQKTTLKMQCKAGECLANELDNIFYPSTLQVKSGIIPFYKQFKTPKHARKISDHLPIYMILSI